jgi:hypothetical protein
MSVETSPTAELRRRATGGVAILVALAGLFTGDQIGKGHEHAALIYVGALLLVVAGVFVIARPARLTGWLINVLLVAYVVLLGATFLLNRP